jgi:hypothetical protein
MRNIFFLILIITIMCSPSLSTTVHSNFTCDATDGKATLNFYSYLKEPTLVETNYNKGYKSKSFAYLYNGTMNFKDDLVYYDGKVEKKDQAKTTLNASVLHYNKINFNGGHGIAEVYDAAFFPNNRAISGYKKILYEDLNYSFSPITGKYFDMLNLNRSIRRYSFNTINTHKLDEKGRTLPRNEGKYKLGDSTSAKYIALESTANMGIPQGYTLDYKAEFKNATFEMNEATGWSNKTGSRMTDWTQSALIHGDAKVRNLLEMRGYFFPAAGPAYDWLPCWFCGTIPSIEQNDSGWPTQKTYEVLRADTLFPTTQLVPITQLVPAQLIPAQLAPLRPSSASYNRMKYANIGLIAGLPLGHLIADNCSTGPCSLKSQNTLGGMNI